MRLTIYIDSKGRIIPANNISAPARAYPICVEKQNRKLRIFVSKKALTRPLSALINHIHMMKDCTIELVSELPNLKSDFFDKPSSCFLRLGQACLELFEKNHVGQFLSHIDFWEDIAEDADQLPFDITNLTKLKIGHLDTPTALAQLLQNETAKAAFYRFTAEQELALVKLPENMVHPPIAEDSLAPYAKLCRITPIICGCKLPDKLPSPPASHCGSLGIFNSAAGQKPACIPL